MTKEKQPFERTWAGYTQGKTYKDECIFEDQVESMKHDFRRGNIPMGLARFGGLIVQGIRILKTQEEAVKNKSDRE